jgi:hypothetical protein
MRYLFLALLALQFFSSNTSKASTIVTITGGGDYVVTGPFIGPDDPVITLAVYGNVTGGNYDGPLPPPPPSDSGINAYGAEAILMVNDYVIYASCYYTQIESMCGRSLPGVSSGYINVSQGFQDLLFSSQLSSIGDVSPQIATFFVSVPDGYSLMPLVDAVPELSTWAMLLIGFAAIGTLTCRPSRLVSA